MNGLQINNIKRISSINNEIEILADRIKAAGCTEVVNDLSSRVAGLTQDIKEITNALRGKETK
jgi:hypothetical protein